MSDPALGPTGDETIYDQRKRAMELLGLDFPGIAAGKCGPACGRDPATGECGYCRTLAQMLDTGIEIEYANGTKETLRRPR